MAVRLALECAEDAADVLAALRREPYPFALDGAWAGGGSIVGAAPVRVARADEDPFALLGEVPNTEGGPPLAGAPPAGFVGGGWFGWLGYGLARRIEAVPPPPPAPVPVAPFGLAYYDHVLRRTPDGSWWLEAFDEDVAAARLPVVRRLLAAPRRMLGAPPVPPLRLGTGGRAGHLAAVDDAVRRIAEGELFQANLCLRLEAEWGGDPLALFAKGVRTLRPAYGAVFLRPGGGVVSFSPELFLCRRGDQVETGPIKGTAPAVPGAAERLGASAKDAAEHVMIVDLMRNDLGRVAAFGTVRADATPRVEDHVGVHHLVSTVSGRLRPGAGDAELLRATFPPGSVTGAPKVQAMRVIAALERTAREAYTGALGYVSPAAGLELAVTIRTFEAASGRLWLGAGGGIVADSDPEAELAEALGKAAPLAAAIHTRVEAAEPRAGSVGSSAAGRGGSARAGGPGPRAAPGRTCPQPPHALAPARDRPDPALGVFETLLVEGGAALHVEAHLGRLAASVAALYDEALAPDLPDRVHALARSADGPARLRVVVVPRRPAALELAPVHTGGTGLVTLTAWTLPGGLGAHKWRDRSLLASLAAARGGIPLIVDATGEVLEAAWASIAVCAGGAWRTPPADGRLLPGTARARLLAEGRAAEAPVGLDELHDADAILLTSALRTVPARLG